MTLAMPSGTRMISPCSFASSMLTGETFPAWYVLVVVAAVVVMYIPVCNLRPEDSIRRMAWRYTQGVGARKRGEEEG